uniref:Geranylgeranyl diphosphate synthase n=1 Tax=Pyramimonas obovata TaxID=1411642 RepID=A0A6T7V5A6_9CHLO|mmetsp:Transcript_15015/g.32259  ORF Transcript_15015/g.32259 Transcript_15015/m.32259 type:complete len:361 (+) Transcript_15015:70-1152(+)
MSAITNTMAAVPVTARMGSKGTAARARAIAARKTNALRFERRSTKVQTKPFSVVSAQATVETEFDFNEYMKAKAVITEKALDESVAQQYPDSVHESMRYSLLAGGKRIRPALCIAACEMFTEDSSVAMPTACALEMIHTMSLMHDDLPCMDNDDFRRGKPTNHKVYGEQCAILAGDGLLTRAFEYIAMATPLDKVDPKVVLRVVAYVAKCVGSEGLVGGQIVDIEMEGAHEEATLETLQYIHAHKTAALLDAAVVSGALLGGATEEDVERLTRYSQNIGLAFQVIDDILDCTQTSEQLGKTAGKDDAVGKTTYPSLLGLEESKRIGLKLIEDAKAELSVYDPQRAAPLIALADYIGSRQN